MRNSGYDVELLTMPGRFWKWRMHGGAVSLAQEYRQKAVEASLILASSMLDLSTFLALTRDVTSRVPTAVYFHENQLAYPWREGDRDRQKGRDVHYGFINFVSALCADHVFFNSLYNMRSFFHELPRMLRHFPDFRLGDSIREIRAKSRVLPLGIDYSPLPCAALEDCVLAKHEQNPVILWNHRWEYDKNPGEFLEVLLSLVSRGLDFRVILLGESFRHKPGEFETACARLGSRVIHRGFAEKRSDYARLVGMGNLLPVTSIHDFFGISVCEAIYSGAFPLLPRRLSYPELVPEEFHEEVFYESANELEERLAAELSCWHQRVDKRKRVVEHLSRAVAGFSWQRMAPVYDAAFNAVVAGDIPHAPASLINCS